MNKSTILILLVFVSGVPSMAGSTDLDASLRSAEQDKKKYLNRALDCVETQNNIALHILKNVDELKNGYSKKMTCPANAPRDAVSPLVSVELDRFWKSIKKELITDTLASYKRGKLDDAIFLLKPFDSFMMGYIGWNRDLASTILEESSLSEIEKIRDRFSTENAPLLKFKKTFSNYKAEIGQFISPRLELNLEQVSNCWYEIDSYGRAVINLESAIKDFNKAN